MTITRGRLAGLGLAIALGVGLALGTGGATPALADNTNCPGSISCYEIDIPGTGNYASGHGLPSEVDTGLGTYCTNQYYSATGTVVFEASAFDHDTGAPQEVRWRVWFALTPAGSATKLFKAEVPSVPQTVVAASNPDGTTSPGYFFACVVNYDTGSPPADWADSVVQGS